MNKHPSSVGQILSGVLLAATFVLCGRYAFAQTAAPVGTEGPIVELRQYKIVAGKREEFIPFFERNFVDTQEAVGIRMIGQFRDRDDNNRFVWIRQFPDMKSRVTSLGAFYFGPVWKAHRAVANPMLDDNDNVLLLHPSTPDSGFAISNEPRPPVAEPEAPGLVIATIYYLWKDPREGFSDFFAKQAAPQLARFGLPVLGSFVSEKTPNDFPQLPVRQGEKVFVWFTRVPDFRAYQRALAQLSDDPQWASGPKATLADAEERTPQVLRLDPTPRSALR